MLILHNSVRRTIGLAGAGMALLMVCATSAMAANRGVGVTLRVAGKPVSLYRESHALVIGASDYTNGWPSLPGVKNDVITVKKVLEAQGFAVTTVLNPTRDQLEGALLDFATTHGQEPEARLLIYYAGHGHTLTTSDDRQLGYIVPVDAPRPGASSGPFKRLALSMTDIEKIALQIESKHALFVFDSCFSGSIFEASRSVPDHISEKTMRPVRQFITAGTAEQTVPDNSVFRAQFVEALEGEADVDSDGYVTGTELGEFLSKTVTNYSQRSQTPQYGKISRPKLDKGDFVFEVGSPKAVLSPAQETADVMYWQGIKDSADLALFRDYLTKFPNGTFAAIAKSKIATSERAGVPVNMSTPPSQKTAHEAGLTALTQAKANGFWVDGSTRLMWTTKDNGFKTDWHSAVEYCRALTVGGYQGWRLPTLTELAGIYDADSTKVFKTRGPIEMSNGFAWSSSQDGPLRRWYLFFRDGRRSSDGASYSDINVALCVRSLE